MLTNILIPDQEISAFCHRYQVRRLLVFGSALRDDFSAESDIDLLVEFEPEASVSLFDMGGMQVELSELLGRTVDLKTPAYLSRYIRQRVLDEAQVLYERG